MSLIYVNNYSTILVQDCSSTDLSLSLLSTAELPSITTGQIIPLTLYRYDPNTGKETDWEIVHVTSVGEGSVEVKRGVEGTVAKDWVNSTTYVDCRITAGGMQDKADSNITNKLKMQVMLGLI